MLLERLAESLAANKQKSVWKKHEGIEGLVEKHEGIEGLVET